MNMFQSIITILIASVFAENYVLSKTIGICPFLGVSKKTNQAFGMGLAVTFVMVLATLVTWPINTYLLKSFNLGYLETIVYILVIASLVQLVEMFLKKSIPALHKSLGIYLPLITTNCAVLAVCKDVFTNSSVQMNEEPSFVLAIVYAVASGLGFLLAMVLFAGVRERIASSKPPKAFEGTPVTLVAAAIVSLAFQGFENIAGNLFK